MKHFDSGAVLKLAVTLADEYGLEERVRARVEESGRVELTGNEHRALGFTKQVHVMTITIAILSAVAVVLGDGFNGGVDAMIISGFISFFVGGLLEKIVDPIHPCECVQRLSISVKTFLAFRTSWFEPALPSNTTAAHRQGPRQASGGAAWYCGERGLFRRRVLPLFPCRTFAALHLHH